MAVKDAEIKVRLTKEEKEFLKKIAKIKRQNMSEFILNTSLKSAKRIEENINSQKIIEDRALRNEQKLMQITEKIRGNNENNKLSKRGTFSFLKRK